VPKVTYKEAIKYPQCLQFTAFVRFIFAPTCCYQYDFPESEEIHWGRVLKRLGQVVVSLLMMTYLFFQHIIPVCEASVPFYEEK